MSHLLNNTTTREFAFESQNQDGGHLDPAKKEFMPVATRILQASHAASHDTPRAHGKSNPRGQRDVVPEAERGSGDGHQSSLFV